MVGSIKSLYHNILPVSIQAKIRSLRYLLRSIWLPIYRIDKDGLTVIQIGIKSLDPYIDKLLFGGNFSRKKVGRILGWNIEWAIQRWERSADLIFFRSSLFRPPAWLEKRMLVLPAYVNQVIELPSIREDLSSSLRKQKGTSVKRDLDRVRKAQFKYEVTRDEDLLSYFYHQLYVPLYQRVPCGIC